MPQSYITIAFGLAVAGLVLMAFIAMFRSWRTEYVSPQAPLKPYDPKAPIPMGSIVIRPSVKDDDALSLVRWKIEPLKREEPPEERHAWHIGGVILSVLLILVAIVGLNWGLHYIGFGWLVDGR